MKTKNNIKLTNLTINNTFIDTARCDIKTIYHVRPQLDSHSLLYCQTNN